MSQTLTTDEARRTAEDCLRQAEQAAECGRDGEAEFCYRNAALFFSQAGDSHRAGCADQQADSYRSSNEGDE